MIWHKINEWGKTYVYPDNETRWLFPAAPEKNGEYWIYIPELKLWRRNTSI